MRGNAGTLSDLTVASPRYVGVLDLNQGLRYASRVGVANFMIWSLCLVVPGQDASGPRDGRIRTRCKRSISPTRACVSVVVVKCQILWFVV